MQCPKCKESQLVAKRVTKAGIEVNICPACHGAWFDAGELESVTSAAVRQVPLPPAARAGLRACPRCEAPMFYFNYPQTLVTVDMCRKCRGLWLDGDELRKIITARQAPKPGDPTKPAATPGGIKGALLHIIDEAIDNLKFW
jgi:hypothetical protein